MTTTRAIRVQQNNDETVLLTFTEADLDPVTKLTVPFNLTGQVLTLFVKATKDTLDSAAMFTVSTASGSITVTDAPNGKATAQFTDAELATSGSFWYHCDAVKSGTTKTAGKGPFIIESV